MKGVAIITRKLKAGKTYEDFRKAWFHTVGFGTATTMYTVINVFNPREIIVIGFMDTTEEELLEKLRIDVKERLDHSLDDIIEPEIQRTFGILVSEDDFSASGAISYKPPTVDGKETNLKELEQGLQEVADAIKIATNERERLKKLKKKR